MRDKLLPMQPSFSLLFVCMQYDAVFTFIITHYFLHRISAWDGPALGMEEFVVCSISALLIAEVGACTVNSKKDGKY